MELPHIGFYVHYHGLGHKHRTEAILQHLRCPATVITSHLGSRRWRGDTLEEVIDIASDIDDVHEGGLGFSQDVPSLHYAPLWTGNVTRRVAQFTAWLDRRRPDLMVVDVSVEISLLVRLASIPQVVMRQHGDRSDAAHLSAYAAAHSLLAPFPESMEDTITPQWVRDKTIYLDGFSLSRTSSDGATSSPQSDRATIVVMFGRGGRSDVHHRLREAAKETPHYSWLVIGIPDDQHHAATPTNLTFLGWIESPADYLKAADVVVTAAGHNSVMEAGRLGCRFIAIAESRPFDEQVRKATVLERERLAIGLTRWPDTRGWPDLIERARQLDPQPWRRIFCENGAAQAARHLNRVAHWSNKQRLREHTRCPSVC